jgi:hypothetical protein
VDFLSCPPNNQPIILKAIKIQQQIIRSIIMCQLLLFSFNWHLPLLVKTLQSLVLALQYTQNVPEREEEVEELQG